MRFSGYASFLLLVSFAFPVAAESLSDAEIKALPPFCQARLNRKANPEQYDYWHKTLGEEFIWTNHYCEGLGYLNRSYGARNQRERNRMLGTASRGIDYLLPQVKPASSLLPDIYFNRGLVHSLQGNNGAAIGDLKKALELNPKLVRAYTLSSNIHVKLKQKKEALLIVEAGLRHVPDSSALQRLYKERGGKLPYPEPIARAPEAPAVPEPAHPKGETADLENKLQETAQQAPATPPSDATAKGDVRVDAQPTDTPKIGSPTNPWCRFCPDLDK